MPQANLPASEYFLQQFKLLQNRVANLESQQLYGVYNNTCEPIVEMGIFPGRPTTYGIQVKDNSGNVRAELGLLPNGDYGAIVSDMLGNSEEILPTVYANYYSGVSTSSATAVTLAGAPTATAVASDYGKYLVTFSSYIGVGGNAAGVVYLTLDGTIIAGAECLLSNSNIGGLAMSCATTYMVTGVTATAHTLGMQFSCSSGSATFAVLNLVVQPL
jgi:hypothetical protein